MRNSYQRFSTACLLLLYVVVFPVLADETAPPEDKPKLQEIFSNFMSQMGKAVEGRNGGDPTELFSQFSTSIVELKKTVESLQEQFQNTTQNMEALKDSASENEKNLKPVKEWFQVLTSLASGQNQNPNLPTPASPTAGTASPETLDNSTLKGPQKYPQYPILKDGQVVDAEALKGEPGAVGPAGPPGLPGIPGMHTSKIPQVPGGVDPGIRR